MLSVGSCCVKVCTHKISECQKLSEKVKTHIYDVRDGIVCSSTAHPDLVLKFMNPQPSS